MLGDTGGFSYQPNQIVRPVHWFYGTKPQATDVRFAQQNTYQVDQAHVGTWFSAPSAEINASENNLREALGQCSHLFYNSRERSASTAAAHEWNDAERTSISTAVLNLEIRP